MRGKYRKLDIARPTEIQLVCVLKLIILEPSGLLNLTFVGVGVGVWVWVCEHSCMVG